MKKKEMMLRILVVLSYIAMVSVNIISFTLPINGETIHQILNTYPNLYTPDDYTFLIWNFIYLVFLFFTIDQMSKKNRQERDYFHYARIIFIAINLLNIIWIIAWNYDYIALAHMMVIVILILLNIYGKIIKDTCLTMREHVLYRVPFSIYYAWITFATVNSFLILFDSMGWKGFGISDTVWTVISIMILTVFAAFRTIRNRDVVYGYVIIWSYVGIYVKHSSSSKLNGAYPSVIIVTIVAIVVILACVNYILFDKKRTIFRKESIN